MKKKNFNYFDHNDDGSIKEPLNDEHIKSCTANLDMAAGLLNEFLEVISHTKIRFSIGREILSSQIKSILYAKRSIEYYCIPNNLDKINESEKIYIYEALNHISGLIVQANVTLIWGLNKYKSNNLLLKAVIDQASSYLKEANKPIKELLKIFRPKESTSLKEEGFKYD